MRFRVFGLALLIVLQITQFIFSQESSENLTLKKCIELAIKKSEVLRIQNERSAQSQQRLIQSKGAVRPQASFDYTKTYRDDADGAYSSEVDDSKISVTQPLFSGFKKTGNIKYSKSEAAKELQKSANIETSVKESVVDNFFSLLKIGSDVANVSEMEKLLSSRMSELNERVRLGKSRESEILAIESQLATLKAQEEKLKGDYVAAAEVLSFLIGVNSEILTITDDLPSVTYVDSLESYSAKAANRFDVKAAAQAVSSQEFQVEIVKAAFYPELNFDGNFYISRSASPSSKWDAALSLGYPLFNGGADKAIVNEELSKLIEYKEALLLTTRTAQTEIKTKYLSLQSSIKQVEAYKEAYSKSEKSYQMQLKDYRYGLVNNLDVISAMINMLETKKAFDKAMMQVKQDKAMLEISIEK